MKENEEFYKSIVDNIKSGFAYHKIILDENHKPIDYEYIEINSAFEEMSGLKAREITGKKRSEIYPEFNKNESKLLKIFGEVALTGKSIEFEHYSEALDKWYQINLICPKPGYFISTTYEITLLKKIEDRVLLSENRYKRIIDTANEGIWELNDQLATKYINEKMCEMLGYRKEEMIGVKIEKFLFKEHIANFLLAFDQLKKGNNLNIECRYKHKNGNVVWAILAGSPIFDEKKKFKGAFGMVTDITARKKTEEALAKSQQNLNASLNGLNDIVILLDIDGKIIEVNETYCKLINKKREDILNLNAFDLLAEEIKDIRIKLFAQVKETGESVSFEDISRGKPWLNSIYPVKNEKGNVISIVAFSKEISERKQIEDSLLKSQQNLNATLNGINDIVLLLDLEGKIIEANETYCKIINRKREEIINLCAFDFLPEDVRQERLKQFEEDKKNGFSASFEDYARGRVWANSTYPIKDNIGNVTRMVVMSRDITESKKVEMELAQSEQNLNSILNSIDDFVLLLSKDGNIIEANNAYLNLINQKREEIINQNIFDLVLPESKEITSKYFNLVMKTGQSISFEINARGLDMLNTVYPLKDIHDNVIRLVTLTKNITERKNLERKIIESEQKFKYYFDHSPYGIDIYDKNGNIFRVNQAFCKLTGYTKEEAESKNIFDFYFNEQVKDAELAYKNVKVNESLIEEEVIRGKDGNKIYIQLETFKLSDNEFISFVRDITERKIYEEKLKKSEEKFRSYFEFSQSPIIIFNKYGKILDSNQASHDISGFSHEEVINKSIFDLVSDKDIDKAVENFNKLIKDGNASTELLIKKKNKEEMLVLLDASQLKDKEFIGFWKDISERKKASENLKKSEEKFRSYFEHNPNAVVIINKDGKILDVNKASCILSGYEENEIKEHNIFEFLPTDSINKGKESFEELIKTGKSSIDTLLKIKGDRNIHIKLESYKLTDEEFYGFITPLT